MKRKKKVSKKRKIRWKKILKNIKKIITENILLIIFITLLILVIILSILVFNKSRNGKIREKADLVVPVLVKDSTENISLNISKLKLRREYVLRITNYRGENVNSSDISYSVVIEKNSKATIKITKNKSHSNLMKNQKETKLEKENLGAKEKDEVYYHFSVLDGSDIKDTDKINIKIES